MHPTMPASYVSDEAAEFVRWARTAALPLPRNVSVLDPQDRSAMRDLTARAKIFAISEPFHRGIEFLEFRNELLQLLSESQRFGAVAIESGIVEAQLVDDYISGRGATLDAALQDGFSWGFGNLPSNRKLVEWLRIRQMATPENRVSFYGYDLPGSPGAARVGSKFDVAIQALMRAVEDANPSFATEMSAKLTPYFEFLDLPIHRVSGNRHFGDLSQISRSKLSEHIRALVEYVDALSERQVESNSWGSKSRTRRIGACALAVDQWLNCFPVGWLGIESIDSCRPDEVDALSRASEVRESAMAENLLSLVDEQRSNILSFSSRLHAAASRIEVGRLSIEPAGIRLRAELGEAYVPVCSLVGSVEGSASCDRWVANDNSLDGLMRLTGIPRFMLDLRRAPASIRAWLQGEHRSSSPYGEARFSLLQAYDVIHFVDVVEILP